MLKRVKTMKHFGRTLRLPPNYGSSLYESVPSQRSSSSSARSKLVAHLPSFSPEDAKLRSWLQRRRRRIGDLIEVASSAQAETSPTAKGTKDSNDSKALHCPFKWVPTQARELAADDVYFRGVHVNSLSPILKPGADVHWKDIDVTKGFAASQVQCCLVGDKMVFCRGLVKCFDSAAGTPIAQLPSSMCPNGMHTFAVLCDGPSDQGNQGLSLGRLNVGRDGWLCIESLKEGCLIDLSGIRFAVGGGLPLAESIQVFACSVSGQRLVMLQGKVSEKVFDLWPGDPLIKLPPDFSPPNICPFVVPGVRSGGFHLVHVAPSSSGGYIEWRDSVWNRDEIELTGVTYETTANLDVLPSTLIGMWSSARRAIVISDFHKFIVSKFGSLESAWHAYNVYGDGQIDFGEFTKGCKLAKFSGNVCRLWSMLDIQNVGTITFEVFANSL